MQSPATSSHYVCHHVCCHPGIVHAIICAIMYSVGPRCTTWDSQRDGHKVGTPCLISKELVVSWQPAARVRVYILDLQHSNTCTKVIAACYKTMLHPGYVWKSLTYVPRVQHGLVLQQQVYHAEVSATCFETMLSKLSKHESYNQPGCVPKGAGA
jgi:hypothetical protein